MAIGAADLSAKAKNGWAWRLGDAKATFAEFEGKLKEDLEAQGVALNIRRLAEDKARSMKIQAINAALGDATDEQIAAIVSTLGVKV